MRIPTFLGSLGLLMLTAGCSQAQSDRATEASADQLAPQGGKEKGKGKGKGKKKGKSKDAEASIAGLQRVGSIKGVVPESSGLCPAPQAGTYYSFGDGGNPSVLYQIDGTGKLLRTLELGAPNDDWESMTRDDQGNYYLGNCGNNESRRRNLSLYRLRPDQPNQLQQINFHYPDQTDFSPDKKDQNFDCEATLWHAGRVYLFTKDRAERTSKVYSVPTEPGDYAAKLVTSLPIPGAVTDAALRPDGRRLVLLAREELFILDGNSWEEILKATPRQVSLAGAGQTEGCTFKDANTLLISTEQGGLFELTLP